MISATGAVVRGRGSTLAARSGEGQYQVVFDTDVRNCTYFANLGDSAAGAPAAGEPAAGEIAVGSVAGNANGVLVVTRDSAGAAMVDRSFHLTVSC